MKRALCLMLYMVVLACCPLRAQIITTYAGSGAHGSSGNGGPATAATLHIPNGLAADRAGSIYFTDELNSRIRKVNAAGIITTIAGTGVDTFSGDGGQATNAGISQAWGVAVDGAGNVYIADQNNYRVRKVNPSGIISTIAGNGSYGYTGDGGPAINAELERPLGIITDGAGNVYVGDQNAHTIRKIDPAGMITTFAGNNSYGYSGDGGPATNAMLSNTYGLATDPAGNVYICDGENNCIRKVNTSGIITTVAGNGSAGFGGDGGPAAACSLNLPTGVWIDGAGNMLIADHSNNRIRRVDAAGIIHTIAGTGVMGFGGDGGLCTNAALAYPTTIISDAAQNIFFTDFANDRIRKITMVLSFARSHNHNVEICENSSVSLDSLLTASDMATGLTDSWRILSGPYYGSAVGAFSAPAGGGYVTPAGLSYTPYSSYVGHDTIVVAISNGIASDTTSIYFTIDPFINNAGTITGDSAVCAGSQITLTESVAGGTWTISNLNAIVNGGLVTGQQAGRDTITYTVTNTCGSAKTSKVITINAVPFAGSITGLDELCVGTVIGLNDTVTGGTWSHTTNSLALNPSAPGCFVTALTAGADTVRYTVTDSVCSSTVTLAITAEPLPTAAISGMQPRICNQTALLVTGIPAGGTWSISNGLATFAPNATGGILTCLTPGNDTLSYTVTNNCGTATTPYAFETDTLPPKPTITRIESTLFAPAGYAAYQWYYDGAAAAGGTADTLALEHPGSYSLLVANTAGCSATSDTLNFPGCSPDQLVIFPNPTASVIQISWCQKVTARLLCMDGKQVVTYYNTNEIDLSGLPDADYMLVLYDAHGRKIKSAYIVKLAK